MKTARKHLGAHDLRTLLERQAGICAGKDCTREGPFEADHIIPLAIGGSNALSNFQLLCKPCHKKKTNGIRGDLNTTAHVKRLREKRTQYDKRKQAGGSRASADAALKAGAVFLERW